MITQQYKTGDGTNIRMTKVCHHNWAGSPNGDRCSADNDGNCAWVSDNEVVVCYHSGFKGPCPYAPSPCRINGDTCVILDKRQRVDLRPGSNRIYNGNSNVDDAPGIINPPFDITNWAETAVVIMDMWDSHPYLPTAKRVGELAKPINDFVGILRSKGALIVHSPSSPDASAYVSAYYKGNGATKPTPEENAARKRGKDAWQDDVKESDGGGSTRTRQNYYYVDDKDMWSDFNLLVPYHDMTKDGVEPRRQHRDIQVHEKDAIAADGLDDGEGSNLAYQQLLGLTANRPNLVYCGVNTNWCILRRHNGMRTMYRAGKSLWIVRDLTDCMSTPNEGVIHFGYTDVVVDWIGRHLNASTATSEKIGMKRFRFNGDSRTD